MDGLLLALVWDASMTIVLASAIAVGASTLPTAPVTRARWPLIALKRSPG